MSVYAAECPAVVSARYVESVVNELEERDDVSPRRNGGRRGE